MDGSIGYTKKHISFSQISLFEKSVREWEKRYVYNEEQTYQHPLLIQGKKFALAMEGKLEPESKEDKNIIHTASALKVMYKGEVEREIRATHRGRELLGYIDLENDIIYEIKTGQSEWTKERAHQHGQAQMYQYMHFLNTGEKKDAMYICLKMENGSLQQMKRFNIPYNEEEIEIIKNRIDRYIDFLENYEPKKQIVI